MNAKAVDITTASTPKGNSKAANLQLEMDLNFQLKERPDLAVAWADVDVEYQVIFQNISQSRKERHHLEGFIQSENNVVNAGKNGGSYMYCRMADAFGKIVEVSVLGKPTNAIEWEAGQFIAVYNATVDFEKIIIGCDTVVHDRSGKT